MPCSRVDISGYVTWICVGVRTSGVPYHYGPGLGGNGPLLLPRLYCFLLCVVSAYCLGMISLIWGEVMICSPWYLLVEYVWDIVGLILFLGAYTILYIWGFILHCS